MTTINTILYHIAYILIVGFLIIALLAIIISDTKKLRDWAREERAKEQRETKSQNP